MYIENNIMYDCYCFSHCINMPFNEEDCKFCEKCHNGSEFMSCFEYRWSDKENKIVKKNEINVKPDFTKKDWRKDAYDEAIKNGANGYYASMAVHETEILHNIETWNNRLQFLEKYTKDLKNVPKNQ